MIKYNFLLFKSKNVFYYLIIFGFTFLIYAQTLTFDYSHWDDDFLIYNNFKNLENNSNLYEIFFENSLLTKKALFFL